MKNLITILTVLTVTFTSAFATTPETTLISTDKVEVVSISDLDIFSSANFDAASENLSFTTNDDISVIQIFNEAGEMEFQLPVMSNNVKINKNLFGEGTFKLGFILQGQSQLHTTMVTLK
jgi:hypothetical protein